VGWMGFSFVFSLYIKYSSKLSLIYGSLTTLVCVILWLYVCMYIFLVGAEVNLYYEQWNAGSSIEKATDITHTHQ
jgi:membrane protein